jgi:hypothetical protein
LSGRSNSAIVPKFTAVTLITAGLEGVLAVPRNSKFA